MSIRAKFTLCSIKHIDVGPNEVNSELALEAVVGSDEDNAEWSKFTPSGSIRMTITNPEALDQLTLGDNYWVDFTLVESPVSG